jgi:hypothetical protein
LWCGLVQSVVVYTLTLSFILVVVGTRFIGFCNPINFNFGDQCNIKS